MANAYDDRVLTLHGRGQGFESPRLHSWNTAICRWTRRVSSGQQQVWPLLQRVASILSYPQVEVTPASQANLSSRSHTCIMQCGSCSLKPAVTAVVSRTSSEAIARSLCG